MYTTKNILVNPLSSETTKKLIDLFLKEIYHDKIHSDSNVYTQPEKGIVSIKSLNEEKIPIQFSGLTSRGFLMIIELRLVIQEHKIVSPTEFGCPELFYQYVKEINFTGNDVKVIKAVQKKFENSIRKNEKLPQRFTNAIYFDFKADKE